MKILFLDSPAFAKQDMLGAFGECGITCDLFFHNAYHDRKTLILTMHLMQLLNQIAMILFFI